MPRILPVPGPEPNTPVGRLMAFTFSRSWQCPPDVTSVLITGFGGGGGGAGASSSSDSIGQGGGGGALMSTVSVAVVPGRIYIISLGAGGAGGATSSNGSAGADTTFSFQGANAAVFSGASGGQFVAATGGGGGQPHKATGGGNLFTGISTVGSRTIAAGADAGGTSGTAGNAGYRNVVGGFDGGAGGALSTEGGGSGGGAGPEGVGAAGGAGSSGTGSPGVSAGANTGAGGGGGGGGGSVGGAGGAGGSGKLYLQYQSAFLDVLPGGLSGGITGLVFNLRAVISTSNSVPPIFGPNGGVTQWTDISGTADVNKNCLQATTANQPGFTQQNPLFGYRPTIDFNGTSDFLTSGTWSVALVQPFTMFAVAVLNATAGVQIIVDNLAGTCEMDQNGGTAQIFAGSVLADTSSAILTNPFVFGGIYNGASSQVFLNQKTGQTVGAGGATGMTGATIGSLAGGGSDWWGGSIAFIAIWNRTLTAAEVSSVMDWLGRIYTLPIGA